jgi:hypothetical protein
MVDDLSHEMNEAVFIAMNQTIDGYIPASFRRGADVQTDDREKFHVESELSHFQALVHDTAASEVRAAVFLLWLGNRVDEFLNSCLTPGNML